MITGIPYNWGQYKLDTETDMERLQRAPMGGQTMIIDVTRDQNGEYDFKVTIVGHSTDLEYHVPGSGAADAGKLYLQSHWGSGVKFTSAKVKRLQA